MATLDGSIKIRDIKNAPRDSRLMIVVIGITMSSVGLTVYPAVNRQQRDFMLISAIVLVGAVFLLLNYTPGEGVRMIVELFACLCAFNVAVMMFPLAFFLLAMSADSPAAYKNMSDYMMVTFMLIMMAAPVMFTYWVVKYLLLKLL